jgi:hypothetical protein
MNPKATTYFTLLISLYKLSGRSPYTGCEEKQEDARRSHDSVDARAQHTKHVMQSYILLILMTKRIGDNWEGPSVAGSGSIK